MVFNFFRNRRRRKLLAQPMPDQWRRVIERNVAVFPLLSAAERQKLINAARIIATERPFVACGGQAMNDEVKLTIAAQASLLLLGEEGYYFEKVPSILVYPMAYARRHSLGSASPVDEDAGMLGESWQRGSIVLSWPAVLSGGRDATDGQNLVLHEFAHHLDSLDGEMGGLPPLPTHEAETRWIAVFGREYDRLCREVAAGEPTLLDPYGTTNKAEMFAVSTECFFEKPVAMQQQHPELFECFRQFYKLDPTPWFSSAESRGHVAAQDRQHHEDESAEVAPADQPPLDSADQYFTRGSEHLDEGRFALAEADFNQAVRLAPDDQEALVYRAESRLWLDHVEPALADADRACRLDSSDAHARRIRGICRVTLGEFQAGLEDLADTVEADDVEALFCRGLAHSRLGQSREALADLTRAIELEPDDAGAHFERARCYERLGNERAAHADRQRARELDPDGDGEKE